MVSFIYSFEMINAVVPEPRIVFWITVSAAASVNPNLINTLLANDVNTCFINGKPVIADHISTILISQVIGCISRVLQKLLKCFNGRSLALTSPSVFPVIFTVLLVKNQQHQSLSSKAGFESW